VNHSFVLYDPIAAPKPQGPRKLTLTAAEIRDDGLIDFTPSYIRSLYRRGEFPPPINPQMNPRMWRWSRTRIERYIETGET
jgi:hypothetical protein